MSTVKVCKKNAYDNGCIPKYKSMRELYAEKNPDMPDHDITSATTGSEFSNQDSILKGSAIVLNDGIIIFSTGETASYLAVDVNGQKGPNKWGTDIYYIEPKMIDKFSSAVFYPVNSWGLKDKGGLSYEDLLYKYNN